LCPEVQFGPALIVWQRVNEKPPLASFERQSRSSAGMQCRSPPPHSIGLKVNTSCCIASILLLIPRGVASR
jgi:hypothetical protein